MNKILNILIYIVIGIIIGVLIYFVVSNTSLNQNNSEEPKVQEVAENNNDTFATDIYNKYSNSVVSVVNLQKISVEDFLGRKIESDNALEQGVGSGFVYKKENGYYYALTNNHVVKGSDEINIILNDDPENPIDADLIGTNEDYDVAVIKFKTLKNIEPVKIGTSENIIPGEPVIAMGSPYGVDFQGTITQGIVSAPIRKTTYSMNNEYQYIQIDAAINPGNSGGPLFNSDGEVIGMNTMKIADETSDNMGFAIPIDEVIEIAKEIEVNEN